MVLLNWRPVYLLSFRPHQRRCWRCTVWVLLLSLLHFNTLFYGKSVCNCVVPEYFYYKVSVLTVTFFFLTSIWFCWISAIREIERAVNAGYHRWKCRQIWPVQNFFLQRFITNQSIKRTKYGLRPTLLNYNLCFSWFVDCIASKLFVPSDSFRTFHESALLVAVVDLLLWSNVLPHRSLINYSMLVKMKK